MNISEQYEMKKEYDKQKSALKNDADEKEKAEKKQRNEKQIQVLKSGAEKIASIIPHFASAGLGAALTYLIDKGKEGLKK